MRLLLLLQLTATTTFSQAQQINGLVKDENGASLDGVTVSLIKAADSSTIKLAVTKANGNYGFSGIKEGNYIVMASHIGYTTSFSQKISFSSFDVTVA